MNRIVIHTLAFCLAGLGCTGPEDFGRCDGTMQVSAVESQQLSISWTPSGCSVYAVVVVQNGGVAWAAQMRQPVNGIASPVAYGTAPSGADGSLATPLVSGQYLVRLTRLDDRNVIHTAAEGTFTHQ
ncbi:MAG: hypothetical protein AB7Q69_17770 [Gemmatimonadales bacterium]